MSLAPKRVPHSSALSTRSWRCSRRRKRPAEASEQPMYHAIVRRKITRAFAGLSAGRIEAITDELSSSAVHYFVGTHALSGTRRTPQSIRAWYERLLRLLQGISFTL